MDNTINLIVTNKEFFVILISLVSVITPSVNLLITKNKEQKQLNFEKFHNGLMKGLSNQDEKTGFDQQIAIIFELRRYPEYRPVINRILKYQIMRWEGLQKNKPHFKQLIKEAHETLYYMDKNIFMRFWISRFK